MSQSNEVNRGAQTIMLGESEELATHQYLEDHIENNLKWDSTFA